MSSGLTPSERGTTEPSETYSPACVACPTGPAKTLPRSSTAPCFGVVRHHAAAERVHGHERVARQPRPERVAQVRPSELARGRLELLVDAREARLPPEIGPVDPHAVVLQDDPSQPVVVRHHEVDERVADGAAVRAPEHALELAGELGPHVGEALVGVLAHHATHRREGACELVGQRAGNDALLDHHAVVELGPLAQVDDPGDARADRLALLCRP